MPLYSRSSHLSFKFLLPLALLALAPQLGARKKEIPASPTQTPQRRATHALNRLTFGPRPGDVQQVISMGIDQWIDLQLHPDRINDATLEARLQPFRTLRMNSHELAENFPDHQLVRQVMDGKKSMPSDPASRAIFEAQIARQSDQEERKAEKADHKSQPAKTEDAEKTGDSTNRNDSMKMENSASPSTTDSASAPKSRRREARQTAHYEIATLIDLPPTGRYKKILALPAEDQLAISDALRNNKNPEVLTGLDAKQKETLQALANPQAVVQEELVQAKLLRAIYSDRQLEEVMTDFWFNHFNVFVHKGADRLFVTSYEQNVIRPHALGKFEELLVAAAKSPAMLFHLDNWLSVGPDSAQALGLPAHPRRGPRPNRKRKQNSGLNENYGRELLELHTLSVNGGYSQRDVTEVAKVFSGWTIEKPNQGGNFKFDPRMHQPGPKFVLGHRIKPKGEDEGREVLHRLATSPQTAHFISLKLAQRFISDDPSPALVDRLAKTFLKKKGDIREILSALFHSPEFWSDDSYRAKVKTPLEFVASAVRATGAEIDNALPLARLLGNMGMPLYAAQPPTGYSMKADAWVSSSALLNRMNFAVSLATGKIRGLKIDPATLAPNTRETADQAATQAAIEAALLASDVSQQTHDSIAAQLSDKSKNAKPAATIAGLLLGSPEFQKR